MSQKDHNTPNLPTGQSDEDRLKEEAAVERIRKALSAEAKAKHKHAYAKAIELVEGGALDLPQFSQAFVEAGGPYSQRHVRSYFMQAMHETGHIHLSDEELIDIIMGKDEQLDGHGG
jgi:hypothetical protein